MIWEIDDGPRAIDGLDAHGRPDPAYAVELGLVPARVGSRVLAAVIELVVAGVIALPALLVALPAFVETWRAGSDAAGFFARGDLVWIIVALAVSQGLMLVYLIVQLVLHGRKGITLGKGLCGIRSVNVRTLESPRFWRGAVVRYLVACASMLVPLLGPLLVIALSPLFDVERRGRGWLDLAADTWFVDVRAGLNPYDEKRMRIARKRLKTPEIAERAPLPSLATPIDRDAPLAYTPSGRLSGGVLGVHRSPSRAADAPPAPKAAAPAPEAAADGVRAVLVLDSGLRIEVRGITLLGRAPAVAAGEGAAQLVPLVDETRSISKTHLAFMPARRGVFVVDRGSTNGSAIMRDGAELVLTAGQPAEVRTGDAVLFGDRSIQVERA